MPLDRSVRQRKILLNVLIVSMTLAAVVWLSYETWRLVVQPESIAGYQIHPGAIDLKQRFAEVQRWFAGLPVYGYLTTATYPPASYVLLWPFVGWMSEDSAVRFWLLTTLPALTFLCWLVSRQSGADTFQERMFVALLPASMYATGATIGNGQLIVHLLPALLCGLLLVARKQVSWRNDLAATVLLVFALIKPSVAAPFFWIVLFVPGRLRPFTLVAAAYGLLTWFAASFQDTDWMTMLHEWRKQSLAVSEWAAVDLSHGNVHSWLAALGLERWNLHASLGLLLALGAWTFRHRKVDIWMLAGVAGIVARLWTYHGWYDDLLILPAMISLFRISKKKIHSVAFGLLIITLVVMIAPGTQYLLPTPYNLIGQSVQVMIWVAALVYLLVQAQDPRWTISDRRDEDVA